MSQALRIFNSGTPHYLLKKTEKVYFECELMQMVPCWKFCYILTVNYLVNIRESKHFKIFSTKMPWLFSLTKQYNLIFLGSNSLAKPLSLSYFFSFLWFSDFIIGKWYCFAKASVENLLYGMFMPTRGARYWPAEAAKVWKFFKKHLIFLKF